MFASFFVVWRESVEALLVIGILYAWIKRDNIAKGTLSLWFGTALGLAFATILALVIHFAGQWYAENGEWFLSIMMLIAAGLIVQMVVWMHSAAHDLKQNIEAHAKSGSNSFWGLITLVTIAVAREGSETVIFLAGTAGNTSSLSSFITGAVLGLAAAIATFLALQVFSHLVPWKWFFRISALLLLLLGGALVVGAADKIIGQIAAYENLPEWAFYLMYEPMWSTNWLYADSSGTLASLVGYHSEPTLSQLLPFAFYWLVALVLYFLVELKQHGKKADKKAK